MYGTTFLAAKRGFQSSHWWVGSINAHGWHLPRKRLYLVTKLALIGPAIHQISQSSARFIQRLAKYRPAPDELFSSKPYPPN